MGAHRTEDPRKYLAMSQEEFKKKHDASLPDIQKHWHIENGELINEGQGLYLTSDKNYRDFELLIDYKTVPLADSGVYLKGCPQVQIWDHTNKAEFHNGRRKAPADCGTIPLVPPAKIRSSWPTSHSASGIISASFNSAAARPCG